MGVDAAYIKARIDEVREMIGRDVVFHTPISLNTYAYIDPVNDTSFQISTTQTTVLARIHWTNDEAITASPGGKYFVGDCQIHIDPMYLSLAEGTQSENGFVVVDGHEMTITKILPVGAPTINRIRIILTGMGARPS